MASRTQTVASDDQSSVRSSHTADETREDLQDDMRVALARIERQLRISDAPEVALYCLEKKGWVRRILLAVVTWPGTNAALFLLLLINAFALAAHNPASPNSDGNKTVFLLNLGINVVFTVEIIAKVMAFGFWGKGSFLSDGWNWLATLVVGLSYLAFVPGVGQLSALRLLRVFEWLSAYRGFRIVINTCLYSLPGMQSVALLCLMTYVVFGLIGLELWAGVQNGVCGYLDPFSTTTSDAVPVMDPFAAPCKLPCNGACIASFGDACGFATGVFDPVTGDAITDIQMSCYHFPAPGEGQAHFNDFGHAFLNAFVMITTQGWSGYVVTLWHTWGLRELSTFLHATHVFLGAWFIFKMTLAVIAAQYSKQVRTEAEREIALRGLYKQLKIERALRHLQGDDNAVARFARASLSGSAAVRRISNVVSEQLVEEHLEQIQRRRSDASGSAAPGARYCAPGGALPSAAELLSAEIAAEDERKGWLQRLKDFNWMPRAALRAMQRRLTACVDAVPAPPKWLRAPVKCIVNTLGFEVLAMLIVIGNAAALCVEEFNDPLEKQALLRRANYALTLLFMAELVMRWIAGGKVYWRQSVNRAELLILLLSLLDIGAQFSGASVRWKSLAGLRAVRAARVLRFVRFHVAWAEVLALISASIPSALYAVGVLLVFMFTFATLGMQLFGGQYQNAVDNQLIAGVPQLNFNTLWMGLVTVYQVSDNENWNDTMFTHLSAFGAGGAIFFVIVILVGNAFFLNLIIAILVEGYNEKREEELNHLHEHPEDANKPPAVVGVGTEIARWVVATWKKARERMAFARDVISEDEDDEASKDEEEPKAGATIADGPSARHALGPGAQKDKFGDGLGPLVGMRDGIGGSRHIDLPALTPPKPPSRVLMRTGTNASTLQKVHAVIPEVNSRNPLADESGGLTTDEHKTALQISVGKDGTVSVKRVEENDLLSPRRPQVIEGEGAALVSGLESELEGASAPAGPPPTDSEGDDGEDDEPEAEDPAQRPTPVEPKKPKRFAALRRALVAMRMLAAYILGHPVFEWAMLLIILYSCCTLPLDSGDLAKCAKAPGRPGDHCRDLQTFLSWSDFEVMLIFVGEMILNVFVRGFYGGPQAYLSSRWRIMDFLIVIFSVAAEGAGGGQAKILRALRSARALRALRLVTRFPQLQMVVEALAHSIPRVADVFVVMFLIILIFGIIGVQSFGGVMAICTDPNVDNIDDCTGEFFLTGPACQFLPTDELANACLYNVTGAAFPRLWTTFQNPSQSPESFDDIQRSMLVVFELITGASWPTIMLQAVNGGSGNGYPQLNANPPATLYFILSQLILKSFIVEMFTSIVIDTYKRLRDERQGAVLLTPGQRAWVSNMQLVVTLKPRRLIRAPGVSRRPWINAVREFAFRVMTWPYFEQVIALVVVANIAIMATKHAPSSPQFDQLFDAANIVFTVIFALEAALRMIALGIFQYFSIKWNVFDFALVVGSVASSAAGISSVGVMLRVLRALRVFRLIRASDQLKQLVRELLFSLPSFLNILLIFGIVVYIFSCVGMQLFAGIRQSNAEYNLTTDINFENFQSAMFLLVRFISGDNQNGLIYAVAIQPPFCEKYGPEANCGWPLSLVAAFYIAYFVVGYCMLAALLTSVVLDTWQKSTSESGEQNFGVYSLSGTEADLFAHLWSIEDPDGAMHIPEAAAVRIIAQLPKPLGTAAKADQHLPAYVRAVPSATVSPALVTNAEKTDGSSGAAAPDAGGNADTPAAAGSGISDEDLKAAAAKLSNLTLPAFEIEGHVQFHSLLNGLLDAASSAPAMGAEAELGYVAPEGSETAVALAVADDDEDAPIAPAPAAPPPTPTVFGFAIQPPLQSPTAAKKTPGGGLKTPLGGPKTPVTPSVPSKAPRADLSVSQSHLDLAPRAPSTDLREPLKGQSGTPQRTLHDSSSPPPTDKERALPRSSSRLRAALEQQPSAPDSGVVAAGASASHASASTPGASARPASLPASAGPGTTARPITTPDASTPGVTARPAILAISASPPGAALRPAIVHSPSVHTVVVAPASPGLGAAATPVVDGTTPAGSLQQSAGPGGAAAVVEPPSRRTLRIAQSAASMLRGTTGDALPLTQQQQQGVAPASGLTRSASAVLASAGTGADPRSSGSAPDTAPQQWSQAAPSFAVGTADAAAAASASAPSARPKTTCGGASTRGMRSPLALAASRDVLLSPASAAPDPAGGGGLSLGASLGWPLAPAAAAASAAAPAVRPTTTGTMSSRGGSQTSAPLPGHALRQQQQQDGGGGWAASSAPAGWFDGPRDGAAAGATAAADDPYAALPDATPMAAVLERIAAEQGYTAEDVAADAAVLAAARVRTAGHLRVLSAARAESLGLPPVVLEYLLRVRRGGGR